MYISQAIRYDATLTLGKCEYHSTLTRLGLSSITGHWGVPQTWLLFIEISCILALAKKVGAGGFMQPAKPLGPGMLPQSTA